MSENENLNSVKLEEEALAAEAVTTPEAPAKQAKKSSPAKKSDKPSLPSRVKRWLREMKSELKKVAWPTKKQTLNNTVVVIVCVIIVGVFIWAFDFLADQVISALIALFKG